MHVCISVYWCVHMCTGARGVGSSGAGAVGVSEHQAWVLDELRPYAGTVHVLNH